MAMTLRMRGWILGLIATLIWGAHYSVGRFIFGEGAEAADPYFTAALSFAFGAASLVPFLARHQGWRQVKNALKEDGMVLVGLAVVGILLENLTLLLSVKYIPAARSSLFANSSPIFTVIIAAMAARKWPTWRQNTGMLLGFAGLCLALVVKSVDVYTGDAGGHFIGDLLSLFSAVCWGWYTVFGTRTAAKYGGVTCSFIMLSISAILMLPVCLATGADLTPDLPLKVWCGIACMGILAFGWSEACWYAAMAYVPPAALGAFGYLSAGVALVIAYLSAGEQLSLLFFVAIALVLFGVWLMSRDET